MTEPKKVHIIEKDEYIKRITELGHLIQYHELIFHNLNISAFKDPREPNDIYVLKSSAEWVLSQ
jgi:hypothetical protein